MESGAPPTPPLQGVGRSKSVKMHPLASHQTCTSMDVGGPAHGLPYKQDYDHHQCGSPNSSDGIAFPGSLRLGEAIWLVLANEL